MTELIKIGIVFFLILVLAFRKVNLGLVLLVSTFLLGLLFHLPVKKIVWDILTSAVDTKTLLILGALVAILFFSGLLKETGRMNEILEGFRYVFKDMRVVIAILPAVIGLMPIVGGALVSAPMVVEGSNDLRLSPERRTFINYWFRHLWESVLPTYPALILTATMIGIPVTRLGWINLPLTLTAIITGILVGFWGVATPLKTKESLNTTSVYSLFKNLFPLIFALVLAIAFGVELVFAFGVTILGMVVFYRIKRETVLKAFKECLGAELLLTVVVVMGFKQVLDSSNAIPAVSEALTSSGVPYWLITMLIPFLVGVMTGTGIAVPAIGFPILISLLKNDSNFLNYMMLAFASGLGGNLISPLHLCLVLTKDYFQADWKGVYRLLWIPIASILAVGLFLAFLRNS